MLGSTENFIDIRGQTQYSFGSASPTYTSRRSCTATYLALLRLLFYSHQRLFLPNRVIC